MTNRTARLFQAANAPEQDTGDIISFEDNSSLSLEESQIAVEAAQSDVVSIEQQAHTLNDVAHALTDIALSMESTLTAGGMFPQTAFFANIAIENQLARVGIHGTKTISVEDVGGALTRVEATQKSVDGLKDKLKKLWDALVEMVQRMWDSIVEFFRNFFTATGRLRERAKRLAEDARSTNVTGDVPARIDIGALVKNISVEGKTDYQFDRAVTDMAELTHDLAKRSIARGKEQGAALAALLQRQATALFEENSMYHIHVGKFTPPPQFKVVENSFHSSRQHGLQKAVSYESPVFPGERVLEITSVKADLSDASYYSKNPSHWIRDMNRAIGTDQYRIVRNEPEHEPSSEIRTPSLREIEDLANAVVSVSQTFEQFTREAAEVQRRARADLNAVKSRLINEQGAKVLGAQGVLFSAMLTAYSRVARQLLMPSATLCGLVMTICGDFVKVSERSLKQHRPETA